jgi:dolichol-phosphate mannosyltransferase
MSRTKTTVQNPESKIQNPAPALVIIPTYNEAENLQPMVEAVLSQPVGLHILIIDDNSPDGTGQIADRLSQGHPAVHVMHRPGKMGLGTAYVAGFQWAIEQGYDYVLEMDCDFSHDPQYLPALIDGMNQYDVVVGSRYVRGGGTVNWGPLRKLISAGGNLFARLVLGLKARDCTAGFKCYRRQVLQTIPWHEVNLQGYAFQVATIYYSQRQGYRIGEIPIIFEDRRVGQSKMSSRIVLEAFQYVLHTRWKELRRQFPEPVEGELTDGTHVH